MNKERVSYKSFSFRLNEETRDGIKEIKIKENKSYNLLFLDFIKNYGKKESKKVIIKNFIFSKNPTNKIIPTSDKL